MQISTVKNDKHSEAYKFTTKKFKEKSEISEKPF